MKHSIEIVRRDFSQEELDSVSARDLWQHLEVKSIFANWIKRRITNAQLIEGQDFIPMTIVESGQQMKEYYLSIDAAKHIAMMERNDKGKELRQYFIDFEKSARQLMQPQQSYALATPEQEAGSCIVGWLRVAKLLKVPEHIAQIEAVKAARRKTGVDFTPLLVSSSTQDGIPDNEQMLEPSAIGKLLGIEGCNAKRGNIVNKFLQRKGFQLRINNEWQPTEEGESYCFRHSWSTGSKTGYNWKWNVSLVKKLWNMEAKTS